ncbi:MAG: hypothetical protein AAB864_00490 [Patescibacteria group bacterium]
MVKEVAFGYAPSLQEKLSKDPNIVNWPGFQGAIEFCKTLHGILMNPPAHAELGPYVFFTQAELEKAATAFRDSDRMDCVLADDCFQKDLYMLTVALKQKGELAGVILFFFRADDPNPMKPPDD